MAIEKKTRYSAVCNGCLLRAPLVGVSAVWYEDLTELINDLMRDGWRVTSDCTWCPKCKEVPK